jgi:hypothetical protein
MAHERDATGLIQDRCSGSKRDTADLQQVRWRGHEVLDQSPQRGDICQVVLDRVQGLLPVPSYRRRRRLSLLIPGLVASVVLVVAWNAYFLA